MTPIDDIAKRSGNGDKEYPIDIRPATVADAGTILALEEHFPGDRLPPRSVRRLLRSPSARILIVERTGIPLGNLVLLMPRGRTLARIYSVIVAPLARGARLARPWSQRRRTRRVRVDTIAWGLKSAATTCRRDASMNGSATR